jgi:hypothetical protein
MEYVRMLKKLTYMNAIVKKMKKIMDFGTSIRVTILCILRAIRISFQANIM